ncbi:DUF4190 domain-containing protein [Demequina phytophila]|uniref:DUF4190 domain-containing protein n=1 Tax=Demequina phytophila TaxID=1638981 RepID=UPI000781A7BC|nr:DUF4190 domain-containing protein [Demequina phytophila]
MHGGLEGAMVDTVEVQPREDLAREGGDGLGISAFVAGCVGLGPVAILLGALGLSRWRQGRAAHRRWPLAGLVLGIVGTVGWAVIAVAATSSDAPAAERDLQAQVDAVTLGNAVVDWYAANPGATAIEVGVDGTSYVVDGAPVTMTLPADAHPSVAVEGVTAYDWCLRLGYDGGEAPAAAYSATAGLVDSCPTEG